MFLLVRLTVFLAAVQSASSLACYSSVRGTDTSVLIGIDDSSAHPVDECTRVVCACASYMFQCVNNDASCTTQQLQNQSIIWGYILSDNTTCMENTQVASFLNVTCCYTDLCNTIGLDLNSTTVVKLQNTSTTATSLVTTTATFATATATSMATAGMTTTTTTSSNNIASILSFSTTTILLALFYLCFSLSQI